jgi:hypothetical protein
VWDRDGCSRSNASEVGNDFVDQGVVSSRWPSRRHEGLRRLSPVDVRNTALRCSPPSVLPHEPKPSRPASPSPARGADASTPTHPPASGGEPSGSTPIHPWVAHDPPRGHQRRNNPGIRTSCPGRFNVWPYAMQLSDRRPEGAICRIAPCDPAVREERSGGSRSEASRRSLQACNARSPSLAPARCALDRAAGWTASCNESSLPCFRPLPESTLAAAGRS